MTRDHSSHGSDSAVANASAWLEQQLVLLAGFGVVYRTVIKLHTHLLVWGDISDPIRGYPPICPPV